MLLKIHEQRFWIYANHTLWYSFFYIHCRGRKYFCSIKIYFVLIHNQKRDLQCMLLILLPRDLRKNDIKMQQLFLFRHLNIRCIENVNESRRYSKLFWCLNYCSENPHNKHMNRNTPSFWQMKHSSLIFFISIKHLFIKHTLYVFYWTLNVDKGWK